MFLFVVFCIIVAIRLLFNWSAKRNLVRLFCDHSVAVTGEKGSGKDLMFSYVIGRRGEKYISNVRYGSKLECIDFDPCDQMGCGGNTLRNLVEGDIRPYEYPIEDGVDFYISDAGCYFPCQENGFLNNRYKSIPLFAALSRHLGDCRIHYNAQLPNRVWDKLREQSTRYIWVVRSSVLFGRIVRMKYYVYDRIGSCQDRIKPYRARGGKFGRALKSYQTVQCGEIVGHTIWFVLRNKYDDRAFKARLRGPVKEDSDESVS